MSDTDDFTTLLADARENLADKKLPTPFLDFTDLHGALIQEGWGSVGCKSSERDYVDQPMLQHVVTAVETLTSIYDIDDSFSESDLRTCIALMVVHDIHKLRYEDGTDEAFDIEAEEVERWVSQLGVDEYAPDIPLQLFQAAMVSLHDYDDRSRHEQAPADFEEYRPYLRIADKVASVPNPSEFEDTNQTSALRTAISKHSTLSYHEVRDARGIYTNVVNQTLSDAITDTGGDIFSIYQNGITYYREDGTESIDVTESFFETVREQLISNLRGAHSDFQDDSLIQSGFKFEQGTRSYAVNERDFIFADPSEIIHGLARRAIYDGESLSGLPDDVIAQMERASELSGMDIEKSRRVEALGRLVQTFCQHFDTVVFPDIDENYRGILVDDILGADEETLDALEKLVKNDPSEVQRTSWCGRYLIAQDMVNRVFPNTVEDAADQLAEHLLSHLESFDQWNTVESQVQDVYDELFTHILIDTEVDGEPLAAYVNDISSCKNHDERLDEHGKTCERCESATVAQRTDNFSLMKKAPEDTQVELASGDSMKIRGADGRVTMCYTCQLELELRFAQHDTSRDDTTLGDRLYIHILPDYAYSPLTWGAYRGLFDRYMTVNATNTGELANSIIQNEVAYGYQKWLTTLNESDTVMNTLTDTETAFQPATGFGTHAIARRKNPSLSETEELFIPLAAAAYAGVRVYVTENPTKNVTATDFDAAVKLDPEFDLTEYTGEELSLSELRDVLKTLSASITLRDAFDRTGHSLEDPMDKLDLMSTSTMLPGAYALSRLRTEGEEDPSKAIEAARLIDERVVADSEATSTPLDEHDGWAVEIGENVTVEAPHIHQSSNILAGTALPFIPDAPLTDKERLCSPLEAAFDALEANTDASRSELKDEIQDAIIAALGLGPVGVTRTYLGSISGFIDQFCNRLIDEAFDGDVERTLTYREPISDAFYAALVDLSTKGSTAANMEANDE